VEIKFGIDEDVLLFLRSQHTGAKNAITSAYLKFNFGINCETFRQIIEKLRTHGHPVCKNANGYFYAQNASEINDTLQQLLRETHGINEAAQGLILSHQVFYDGGEVLPHDD